MVINMKQEHLNLLKKVLGSDVVVESELVGGMMNEAYIVKNKEGNFEVPSKISEKYTHMEIDPMIILGVASGIVPYPEHNSAPRVTMGAGMGKQALGVEHVVTTKIE